MVIARPFAYHRVCMCSRQRHNRIDEIQDKVLFFSIWTTNEVEGRSGNKKTKTDFAVLQRKCKDSGRTIFHC